MAVLLWLRYRNESVRNRSVRKEETCTDMYVRADGITFILSDKLYKQQETLFWTSFLLSPSSHSTSSMEPVVALTEMAPRPPKKARREASSSAGDKARPARRMYFILCRDANENIIRSLSEKPNARYWEKHAENACSVYNVRGELGKFMSSRFKLICVSSSKYASEFTRNWISVDKKDVARKS